MSDAKPNTERPRPAARPAPPRPEGRLSVDVNHDWAFEYRPSGALDEDLVSYDFDDSDWQAVGLPHTWQTCETTGELHPFLASPSERDDAYWWYGLGYYRKRFTPSSDFRGKRLSVEFDGVQKRCWIFLNGVKAGEHLGGYNSFSVDLTDEVRWGRENVLAVAVSNRRDDPDRVPPMMAGNFNLYGGIYRDARFVFRNPVHIPYQGNHDHEGGTFITTPQVSRHEASLRIRTFIRNAQHSATEILLKTLLLDPKGQEIEQLQSRFEIGPGESAQADQDAQLSKPLLWAPEHPHLYHARSEVWVDGVLSDNYASPFGFRWFWWDEQDNSLFLNGKRLRIRGTNRHQEYPWLGDAIPKWIHRMDLERIRRDMNMNFMRGAHYPNDPHVYDLADRLGIIMVEEVPNIKSIPFSEEVQARNLRSMVRRDRNHPSILFWSLGNETSYPAKGSWVHEQDPTRIIHLRHGPDGDPFVEHSNEQLEMESQLRVTIRGWTDSTVKDACPENGQHASTEEWQHHCMRTHENGRARIDEDIVHWIYADHGADREYRNCPLKHVNAKGWLDAYRIPKYGYHLWRANWSEKDILFIHPHSWQPAKIGTLQQIRIDSNADSIELFVGDRSVGSASPASEPFHTVTFADVMVERSALMAVAIRQGRTFSQSLPMPGSPARIKLSSDQMSIPAHRNGIALIRADVLDDQGVPLLDASPPIAWSLEGDARWVGPESWSSDLQKSEAGNGCMYTTLPVVNVLRASTKPGKVRVRASSPGLQAGELEIEMVKPDRPATDFLELPQLDNSGRRRVRRDRAWSLRDTDHCVPSLPALSQPIALSGLNKADQRRMLREHLLRVPFHNSSSMELYKILEDFLLDELERSSGELIEDDVNFAVSRFNDASRLQAYLDDLPLNDAYKRFALPHFTRGVIRGEIQLQLDRAKELFLPLLNQSYTVMIDKSAPPGEIKYHQITDVYTTNAETLGELIEQIDRTFSSLSSELKARAIQYTVEINPWLPQPMKGETLPLPPTTLILPGPLAIHSIDGYCSNLRKSNRVASRATQARSAQT